MPRKREIMLVKTRAMATAMLVGVSILVSMPRPLAADQTCGLAVGPVTLVGEGGESDCIYDEPPAPADVVTEGKKAHADAVFGKCDKCPPLPTETRCRSFLNVFEGGPVIYDFQLCANGKWKAVWSYPAGTKLVRACVGCPE